jgi:hypothetical protein
MLTYLRYWYATFSSFNYFSYSLPDVSAGRTVRELRWTSQEISPAGIIIMSLQVHISLAVLTCLTPPTWSINWLGYRHILLDVLAEPLHCESFMFHLAWVENLKWSFACYFVILTFSSWLLPLAGLIRPLSTNVSRPQCADEPVSCNPWRSKSLRLYNRISGQQRGGYHVMQSYNHPHRTSSLSFNL